MSSFLKTFIEDSFTWWIPKLIMEWIPLERRKRGRPLKTWMEGVRAAMTTRNLEPDQILKYFSKIFCGKPSLIKMTRIMGAL